MCAFLLHTHTTHCMRWESVRLILSNSHFDEIQKQKNNNFQFMHVKTMCGSPCLRKSVARCWFTNIHTIFNGCVFGLSLLFASIFYAIFFFVVFILRRFNFGSTEESPSGKNTNGASKMSSEHEYERAANGKIKCIHVVHYIIFETHTFFSFAAHSSGFFGFSAGREKKNVQAKWKVRKEHHQETRMNKNFFAQNLIIMHTCNVMFMKYGSWIFNNLAIHQTTSLSFRMSARVRKMCDGYG